ncbi:hypothetical protein KKC97_13215, partial [bacterium]|nr:hypothetical protein [bacterium]
MPDSDFTTDKLFEVTKDLLGWLRGVMTTISLLAVFGFAALITSQYDLTLKESFDKQLAKTRMSMKETLMSIERTDSLCLLSDTAYTEIDSLAVQHILISFNEDSYNTLKESLDSVFKNISDLDTTHFLEFRVPEVDNESESIPFFGVSVKRRDLALVVTFLMSPLMFLVWHLTVQIQGIVTIWQSKLEWLPDDNERVNIVRILVARLQVLLVPVFKNHSFVLVAFFALTTALCSTMVIFEYVSWRETIELMGRRSVEYSEDVVLLKAFRFGLAALFAFAVTLFSLKSNLNMWKIG